MEAGPNPTVLPYGILTLTTRVPHCPRAMLPDLTGEQKPMPATSVAARPNFNLCTNGNKFRSGPFACKTSLLWQVLFRFYREAAIRFC